jgi:hypothetical protein
MQGVFFVSPDIALCFALLQMVSGPFASPWGVDILSVLSQLCWVVALALGDWDLLSQVILFWLFFRFWSLVSFLFLSFMNWWLCVLSVHSSRGRLRTGASEDRWMVGPWCDQRLEGWHAQAPQGFADARKGALSRHPTPFYWSAPRGPARPGPSRIRRCQDGSA